MLLCTVRSICVVLLLMASTHASLAAGDAVAAWPDKWASKGSTDHPLVGKIFAPHSKKFVPPKEYLQALTWPRFVLLGEVHDNPDHHILQALAIKHAGGGGALSVVFEHFRSDQQAIIDAFQAGDKWMKSAGRDDQIARLFLVTGWADSGWPDGEIFRPLVEVVLSRNAKILAGNPPRRRVYEVARQGDQALSGDAQKRLLLDKPLGEALDSALLDDLEASHCGLMPKSAFGNMAIAQRFRDGHMARVMVDAALREGPVVLVAGNEHVRKDRGVPWYLRQMITEVDERPLIAVGHVEVVEGKTRPQDYAAAMAQFSMIVFTPRKVRADPCVKMRKRFGKHKQK